MLFDPKNNKLYTDQGIFLKKLFCPYKVKWEKLNAINEGSRKCSQCDQPILDSALLSDKELIEILQKNPDTCLKINLHQANLKII